MTFGLKRVDYTEDGLPPVVFFDHFFVKDPAVVRGGCVCSPKPLTPPS